MWEEFVQAIQTFLTYKANLSSLTKKGRKVKLRVIPYCWFTKLIICHVGRTDNIHQRSASPFHLAEEDLRLDNLKFVPKGENDEQKREEKKKPATAKNIKSKPIKDKLSKLAPAPKPKGTQVKPTKPSLAKHSKLGKVLKTHKRKSSLQLIDENEPTQPEPEPEPEHQREGDEYDRQTLATEEALTRPSAQPYDDASVNIFCESPSLADAETGADIDKTNSGDPGKTPKSRPPPKQVFMDEDQAGPDHKESRAALAGPNREPTHDDFMANVYLNVRESLKFLVDEHVIIMDPLSSTRTLSLMKNLDDAYTIKDQFLNEKSTKAEPRKLNVKAKVVSMVTGPIYQATSSVPPLSTPVIDISPSKPRRRDDQDPPPPSPDSDPSKKRTHDSDATRPTQPPGSFIKRFCKRIGKKKLRKSDLEGPTFKIVKPFYENNISLQFQMEECQRLLTDQVDLVNPEGHQVMPDVSKLLPLGGPPEFGLEELVPSLWIESKRDYNISAAYGITHWWFKRKDFYITRHNVVSNRHAVRSHMRIISVISIDTFERYGYAFPREIVIRRANYNEYKIFEANFKNMHLNDFEDLFQLHLQGKLNHLPGSNKVYLNNAINLWIRNIVIKQRVGDLQLGIKSSQTKLNLTKPR
nr:hypothetical protein [Tanacetum cinerariifolium]